MRIGQGYCISQHFSSVCWPAVEIYWDTSGEQVNRCTADKSMFCKNEQVFGFFSEWLIPLPNYHVIKRRLVLTGQSESRFAPEWKFTAPLLCWYWFHTHEWSLFWEAQRFRVASSVSLLAVFVWIFPLRLHFLSDQERLHTVSDTVGIHL